MNRNDVESHAKFLSGEIKYIEREKGDPGDIDITELKAVLAFLWELANSFPTWQPIATAPRDGSTILLSRGPHDLAVGFWRPGREGWGVAGFYLHEYQPKFWMPLPPLPTENPAP